MKHTILGVVIFFLSTPTFCQPKEGKSFAEQFKESQQREQREKTFQGERKESAQSLNDAKRRAQANVNSCAPGAVPRKSEDVASYLEQEDGLQKRFAASIEAFTQKAIDENEAISQKNGLINEHNKLVIWSHGKVTNGTCCPKPVTEIIGKAYSTTVNLINEYKRLLGV